jgi:hypothetical protein
MNPLYPRDRYQEPKRPKGNSGTESNTEMIYTHRIERFTSAKDIESVAHAPLGPDMGHSFLSAEVREMKKRLGKGDIAPEEFEALQYFKVTIMFERVFP